jgi:hypothetical protein
MVNVDENFPVRDVLADPAKTLKARAIGGDDTVEFHPGLWLLHKAVPVEKLVFLRQAVLIPANDFFAFVLERQREAELRTHAIAVGPDVADDAKGFAFADRVQNAINDFRITFHG